MADIIPSFTGTNHLGRASESLQAFDANASERLKAIIEGRSEIMRGVMSNLDRIAHTSGPNAPDRALGNFGMAPAFGGADANQLHGLHLAGLQADIAAKGRIGRGGGDSSGGGGKSSDIYVYNPNTGMYTWMDTTDMPQERLTQILDGSLGLQVLQWGRQGSPEMAETYAPFTLPPNIDDLVTGTNAQGQRIVTDENGNQSIHPEDI